jgi:hypothetical protein
MKIKVSFILLSGILIILLSSGLLFSYPGGAPAGKTGSPGDVNNCNSCHNASIAEKEGYITSDAENQVYTPGSIYTITASMPVPSNVKRMGFEVSPQSADGKLQGKMIVTDKDRTQLVGKGKYITHTSKGSDATGAKNWSFQWQAPVAGSGDVTFYGAFLIGGQTQFLITSSYKLSEKK